jgi:PadR family transcriptional regulator, regulatory protein PadR
VSDNNRTAKFYQLTRAGLEQVGREAREWNETTALLARFFSTDEISSS